MKIEEKLKAIDRKYYWIIAYVLAAVGMFLVFLYEGMIVGDYLAIRSDNLAGNMAGIRGIMRFLRTGENIFFTYDCALGINNALAVAGSALSPFNIFYLIFFSWDENVVTIIITILKVASIGASFQYFSRKVLKSDGFLSVVISVFFALSAFVIGYGMIHLMWLDAVILLPLLIVAIIRCLEEGKRAWLIVLYTLLFITHFYMAYMVGFFTLFFVLGYMIFIHKYSEDKPGMKQFATPFFNWFLSVVIAVLLSAVIWAPVLFFILGNRVEDSTDIMNIEANIFQILNSLYWGQGYGILGNYAYIYCGIPVVILVPFYFLNKDIRLKEKLFAGILLGLLIICTVFTPFNSFMHVFDQPDCFWYRYSFLISFCLCALACKQIQYLDRFKGKALVVVICIFALFYQLQQQMNSLQDFSEVYNGFQNSTKSFLINMLFLAGWCVLFYFYQKVEDKRVLISVLCAILVLVETSTSALNEIPQKELKETYYTWYEKTEDAVNDIKAKDDGLFRTIVTNSFSMSTGQWFAINGLSYLGDQEKYKVRRFLSNIGFATSARWSNETGYTPVSEMLLGIKYNIVHPSRVFDFDENPELNEHSYLVNDKALSYGYMVSGDVILYDYPGRNVFENMNTLVTAMTRNDLECFDKISDDDITYDMFNCSYKDNVGGMHRIYRDDTNGSFYVTVKNSEYQDIYMQIEVDEPAYYGYDFFVMGLDNVGATEYVPISLSNACRFYYNKEKDKYNLYLYANEGSSPQYIEFNSLNIYGLNEENFNKQYEELAKGQLNITEWSNGHIKGTVNIEDDKRLMLLTIPYDPGWSAKVDGRETDIVQLIDGAFIGVFLPGDGEHTVEFDYEVPGLRIGLAVSLCGIIAFLAVVFEKQLKKMKSEEKNKKEEKEKKAGKVAGEKEQKEKTDSKKEQKKKEESKEEIKSESEEENMKENQEDNKEEKI